jgi:hypothetical protein
MVNNQYNNKYQSSLKRRLAIITGKETEVINKVMASKDYCTKVEGVQNISQLDSLISMIDKLNPSVSDRIKTVCEQAKNNAIAFSEQVKVTLETTAIKVICGTVNINKKIFSCSRTPRSNNRTSSFSKSSSGDSGDPDQPDPDQPPGPKFLSLHVRNNSPIIAHNPMSGGGRA